MALPLVPGSTQRDSTSTATDEAGAEATRSGGGRTLSRSMPRTTAQLARRVQRSAAGDAAGATPGTIADVAAHGTSGAGQSLPHLDRIQESFGLDYPIGGVRAHVGGVAAEASETLGAHGYASGNDVAFASAPGLHLAAHEAAHVVQQRAGVQLSSEVGEAGDRYEQHADRVADAVVRGESAAPLLAEMAGGGGASVASGGVQRKEVQLEREESLYDVAMRAFTPEQRFAMAEHGEQVRTLRGAPHKQRVELLEKLDDEKRQLALIRGLQLEVYDRFRLFDALPSLLKLLKRDEIMELFDEPHGKYGQDRILYGILTIGQQMETFNQFSATRMARLYPSNGTAEHAALLSTVSDRDLTEILAAWEEEKILRLLPQLPPHVSDRLRRLAKDAHPNLELGLPAQGADDQTAATAEAAAAEEKKPAQRRPYRPAVPIDEFRERDWEGKLSAFEDGRPEQRARYLGAAPGERMRLFRTQSASEMAATLSAINMSHVLRSVVRELTADEMVQIVFSTDDAALLARIYPQTNPMQRYVLIPAMSAAQIAVLLANVEDNGKQDLWATIKSAASIDVLTAAMRRMSDEALSNLHFQLDPFTQDELIALLPAERRALFAKPE